MSFSSLSFLFSCKYEYRTKFFQLVVEYVNICTKNKALIIFLFNFVIYFIEGLMLYLIESDLNENDYNYYK